jgi:type IV fimbrial biogenesis protein FimT
MHPVKPRGGAGFTMIEMMVTVAILAITLGIGIPSISGWLMANKAASATEFYMEGFRAARQQAIGHNTNSRIMLTANQTTGQMDWRVDICFPTVAAPCTAVSSNWSTASSGAAGDPETGSPYMSLFRSADILPPVTMIAPTVSPAGAFTVYYTGLGWVDTTFPNRIQMLTLDPVPAYANALPKSAIAITLAGMPTRCDDQAAAGDSRRCAP